MYKGCSGFFRWLLVFCFLPLVFCPKKLFTITTKATANAPKKAYNLLIYSVLLCFYSVLFINNRMFISFFNSVLFY